MSHIKPFGCRRPTLAEADNSSEPEMAHSIQQQKHSTVHSNCRLTIRMFSGRPFLKLKSFNIMEN